MRGVIYARYSSIGQREESVEGQLRECKAFAERKGIIIVGTFIDRADKTYQRAIIDIFVNAIYLYDDKIVLTYNFKSDSRTITLSDIESSDLPQNAPPPICQAHARNYF